jgi:hypothetical protein
MGAVVPIPTLPVVTLIDETVILDTALSELTASVEKAPVPVPGALLLILDTVSVERVIKEALILDRNTVDPCIVEPVRVEYIAIGAVICVVSERVLPVRVDKLR